MTRFRPIISPSRLARSSRCRGVHAFAEASQMFACTRPLTFRAAAASNRTTLETTGELTARASLPSLNSITCAE